MRKIWFPVLAVSMIILAPALPVPAAEPYLMLADAQTALALTKDDRILGNPDAPITIVEYASLTCPHCAHFANDVLPELKKKWIDAGKVKLVLRDYPLDEPALRAAMIAGPASISIVANSRASSVFRRSQCSGPKARN